MALESLACVAEELRRLRAGLRQSLPPKVGQAAAQSKLDPSSLKATCFQPLTPDSAYIAFNLNPCCCCPSTLRHYTAEEQKLERFFQQTIASVEDLREHVYRAVVGQRCKLDPGA